MKYSTPKYEITVLETQDIIASSVGKYEIVSNDDGSGDVIVTATDLFGI